MSAIIEPAPDLEALLLKLDDFRLCLMGRYTYLMLSREGLISAEDERIFARTFAYGSAKYGEKFEIAYFCIADMVPE